MATIGQQLATPEAGWIRYDDIDPKITYAGNWTTAASDANTYAGTGHYANTNYSTTYYEFTFYGDSFRIIDLYHTNRVSSVTVTIDGSIIEAYKPNVSSSATYKILCYEKTGLDFGVHKVRVSTSATSGYFSVDAIDIPEYGHMCDASCKHAEPLTIHKTLKANLPESVKSGTNQVHFTEDGGIFINNKAGELKQCNTGEIIKEISNPLTTSPLEFGNFRLSSTQTTNFDYINFDTVVNGNMSLNDRKITLKANKTYSIVAGIYMHHTVTDSAIAGMLMNTTDNIEICRVGLVSNKYTGLNVSDVPMFNCIFTTPEHDIEIGFTFSHVNTIGKIRHEYTTLTIQEVRNNPVNQYGGFETEVLFDGNASVYGTSYTLSDAIDNYNYIYVKADVTNLSNKTCLSTSLIIMKDDFVLGDIDSYILNIANTDSGRRYVVFGFKDVNNLTIGSIIKYTNDISCGVSKIIGIKGQLPSLLCGGEF